MIFEPSHRTRTGHSAHSNFGFGLAIAGLLDRLPQIDRQVERLLISVNERSPTVVRLQRNAVSTSAELIARPHVLDNQLPDRPAGRRLRRRLRLDESERKSLGRVSQTLNILKLARHRLNANVRQQRRD